MKYSVKKTPRIYTVLRGFADLLPTLEARGDRTLFKYPVGKEFVTLSNAEFASMIRRVAAGLHAAGLGGRGLSVHKLRHTAATLMYGTGKVDVRVLKDILGHEQLNTTQIYTHVSNESMEQAMQENPLAKVKRDKK